MDLHEIVSAAQDIIQANPEGTIAAAVILLFVLWKNPRLFLVLVSIAIAVVGVLLVFDKISSTGISSKKFNALSDLK